MKKKKYEPTQAAAANRLGVSTRTFTDWTYRENFPGRTKRGFDIEALDKWCQAQQLGRYSPKATRPDRAAPTAEASLHQLRIQNLRERTEREKIGREREQIELDQLRGQLLLSADVETFHKQVAATVMMLLTSLPDMIDRELPDKCPDLESWETVRQRVILAGTRLSRDVASAVESFVFSDGDDNQVADGQS